MERVIIDTDPGEDAVMEAAAQVGFDGTDGDMAVLDMEEGATVACGGGRPRGGERTALGGGVGYGW